MSQHDYVIANDSGASVRSDLNSVLQAILSQNSGTSAPTSTASGTLWLDTTGGAPYTLKIRDAGNNHWLTLASITDPGSDGNLSVASIEGTAVISTGESGGNKFLREDGDGTCSWQLGGKIVQIVQTVKTDTTSKAESAGSINWTDISGMTCNIPPQSGNKVLVFVTANLGGRVGYMASIRLLRGSTAINIGDSDGSRTRNFYKWRGEDVEMWPANTMFVDASPGGDGSTAITYKLQWTGESSNTMYLNRAYSDVNNYYHGTSTSNITLMEVQA